MCLSPITIPNQTKYVSLRHRDPFLMQVPCGTCAECQATLSNQWYYRAYYEWLDLQRSGGYVLFDCLTYRPNDLPHLSDFWNFISKNEDYPCFNHSHIRKFLQLLRVRLIRKGYLKDSFRYFLSTEYGTDDRYTHRPHIHLMLYVHDNRIDPVYLSRLISDCWLYGRTDGVLYKGVGYVMRKCYIPTESKLSSKLRTCRYVTKYVQKCCMFQSELNKRLNKVMFRLATYADPVTPDKWLSSEAAHRERLKLSRYVNQFHRQSQHFGESALADIDLNQLERDGCLFMPDAQKLRIAVPLPMYYKRKLFYEQVEFNGSRYWQLTPAGVEFNNARRRYSMQRLVDRYNALVTQYNLPIRNIEALASYVMDIRGSIRGDLDRSTLEQRIDSIDYINYSTCSDKLNFGCRGLTRSWLGDSQQGYTSSHLFGRIPLSVFIQKYCQFDEQFEHELDLLFTAMFKQNVYKQEVFEKKQKLKNLYKHLLHT